MHADKKARNFVVPVLVVLALALVASLASTGVAGAGAGSAACLSSASAHPYVQVIFGFSGLDRFDTANYTNGCQLATFNATTGNWNWIVNPSGYYISILWPAGENLTFQFPDAYQYDFASAKHFLLFGWTDPDGWHDAIGPDLVWPVNCTGSFVATSDCSVSVVYICEYENVTFACNIPNDNGTSGWGTGVLEVGWGRIYLSELPKTILCRLGSYVNVTWYSVVPRPMDSPTSRQQWFWNSTSGLLTVQSGIFRVPIGGGSVTATYNGQLALDIIYAEGGSFSPSPGRYWFDANSTAAVEAIPGESRFFDHWVLDGLAAGSGSPLNVTMDQPHNLTAVFVSPVTVVFNATGIDSSASETVLTVDGVEYACRDLPASFEWEPSSVHSFSFAEDFVQGGAKRSLWLSTEGLSNNRYGYVAAEDGSVTANYQLFYLLNVTADPKNGGGVSNSGWYAPGCRFWVSSAANSSYGYFFSHWVLDGEYAGNESGIEILMDGPHNLTAVFKRAFADFWVVGVDPAHPPTSYVLEFQILTNPALVLKFPWLATPGSGLCHYRMLLPASTSTFFAFAGELQGNGYQYVLLGVDGVLPVPDPSGMNSTYEVHFVHTAYYGLQWNVTFVETGLDSTAQGTVLTVNGASKSHANLPYSFWADNGSLVTYDFAGIVASTADGKRFNLTSMSHQTPLTVTSATNVTGAYAIQYRLSVESAFGVPSGAGWYDGGSTAFASLADGTVSGGTGVRYVFTGWERDASGSGLTSDPILMDRSKTATADWKTQYYLTVTTNPSGVDSPTGEGWYDAGSTAHVNADLYVDIVSGSRYRFDSWAGASGTYSDATVVMDSAKTVTANYVAQYRLTVSIIGSGTVSIAGSGSSGGWFDSGLGAWAGAFPDANWTFSSWLLDGADAGTSNPLTVTMGAPHSLVGVFVPVVVPPPPEKPSVNVNYTVNVEWGLKSAVFTYRVLNESCVPGLLALVVGNQTLEFRVSDTFEHAENISLTDSSQALRVRVIYGDDAGTVSFDSTTWVRVPPPPVPWPEIPWWVWVLLGLAIGVGVFELARRVRRLFKKRKEAKR